MGKLSENGTSIEEIAVRLAELHWQKATGSIDEALLERMMLPYELLARTARPLIEVDPLAHNMYQQALQMFVARMEFVLRQTLDESPLLQDLIPATQREHALHATVETFAKTLFVHMAEGGNGNGGPRLDGSGNIRV